MKNLAILLLTLSLPVMGAEQGEEAFILHLMNESPSFRGVPLRDVEVKDIDGDGLEEILLFRNEVEESAIGFLNVELYEALVWIDIYKRSESGYVLSTHQFETFNAERKEFYSRWLERIESGYPKLSDDSRRTLELELDLFVNKISEYIRKIESFSSR